MWNMKCFVTPVIIGATGIASKELKKYLETIPGNHSIDSLQKNSCSRNITHYKESATIRNLKPEQWGSPLVQEEKYQEKPVKREISSTTTTTIIIMANMKAKMILARWHLTCQSNQWLERKTGQSK
jgi:hypothetical protein